MYSFNSKVRFTETDQNQQLSLASLVEYFQDCSIFHSETVGLGLNHLKSIHRAWIMNSWQINIEHLPFFGEDIQIATWSYGFKGIYGYRNFTLTDSSKNLCAYANSIWIFMDMENYRPVRIPPEEATPYHSEKQFPMKYETRKLTIPYNLVEQPSFPVVPSNIDTNKHVNNTQYIKMAQEYIPTNFLCKQIRAEYRMSAVLGDLIIPKVNLCEDIYTVVLTNKEEKPFTIITFNSKIL